jgi:CubicO group peptidase (beta-lactamase class C family)
MDETLALRAQERSLKAIADNIFPGVVIGIVYASGQRILMPFGKLTYDENASAVREDTIYDIASVTKSIPTASLALHFLDEGKLKLTDKLSTFVPEFRNSDRDLVTIKHLLTYTVGGYPLSAYKMKTPQELYETIMTRDFSVKPGTGFLYANVPAFLLGLVVEKIGGHTLDNLALELFFKPLHMERTSFFTRQFNSDDIAPTEIDSWRGLVCGSVHDESAYVFTEKGGKAVGHAGLFSTAPDLLNFLEMFLNEGDYHGHHYFSSEIIRALATNQISELNATTGLGWQLAEAGKEGFMGRFAGRHTFGKTGFTGASVVCDIERGVAFTILSNCIYPKRPKSGDGIRAFRNDIAEIILRGSSEV